MLNRKQILKIRELNSEGFSIGQISKELNISYKTVQSYLKNLQLSTQSQNLNNGEHASNNVDGALNLEKFDENPEIPNDPSKVLLAPQLKRKLDVLGMTPKDIFEISPKSWWPMLTTVEKHALKIFLQKYNVSAEKELKEIENEAFIIARRELARLGDECEFGKIDFEEWDRLSEELILTMEAEFSL